MEGFNCPSCSKFFIPNVVFYDGGGIPCTHCGVRCHKCIGGKGNWGPIMSCKCSRLKKSTGFDCPSCHSYFEPQEFSRDGGSTNCPRCGMQCHRCLDGKGNWGSPLNCRCRDTKYIDIESDMFQSPKTLWGSPFS